jgi:hypothetical protein
MEIDSGNRPTSTPAAGATAIPDPAAAKPAAAEPEPAAATPAAAEPAAAEPGGAEPGARASASAPSATGLDEFRVACLMNARYHASREGFLDSVHRWFMFAIIVSGASVILDFIGAIPDFSSVAITAKSLVKAALASITVVLAASDLAFDLSNRARTHSMMKRRYFELLADVLDGDITVESANAKLNRMSADEEPAFHALMSASFNAAQEMVYGGTGGHYKLTRYELFFKNVFRFEGTKFDFIPQ